MADKIAFENGRISIFEGLVTLTLTLDRVSTYRRALLIDLYIPFIEIEETFCGRTGVRTHGRTFETGFIRSTLSTSRPKNAKTALKQARPFYYVRTGDPVMFQLGTLAVDGCCI